MALSALIPFAVDVASTLLSGGGTATPGTIGEPSAAVVTAMFQRLTGGERAKLAQLWTAAGNKPPLYDAIGSLAVSPAQFAYQAWGGSDGQVTSSGGKALKAYVQELLAGTGATAAASNPAFIPEQYIPEIDRPGLLSGGVNVTGHVGSDGKWTIDVGGAAGDPGYVAGARPGAWLGPLMFAAAAVVLVLVLVRPR